MTIETEGEQFTAILEAVEVAKQTAMANNDTEKYNKLTVLQGVINEQIPQI
jgi:hypothetical protein